MVDDQATDSANLSAECYPTKLPGVGLTIRQSKLSSSCKTVSHHLRHGAIAHPKYCTPPLVLFRNHLEARAVAIYMALFQGQVPFPEKNRPTEAKLS
jgi:hypothetical protein